MGDISLIYILAPAAIWTDTDIYNCDCRSLCVCDLSSYLKFSLFQGLGMLTGHSSGHVNLYNLEPVEDLGALKPKCMCYYNLLKIHNETHCFDN